MKKSQYSNKKIGAEAFDEYYQSLFTTRWPSIKASLLSEVHHISWDCGSGVKYFLDSGSVLAAMSLPLAPSCSILDMCAAPGGKSLVVATRMDDASHLTSNERSSARKNRLVRVLDDHLVSKKRENVSVTMFDAARWCCHETESFDRILLDAPCSSERHVLSDSKYLSQWTVSRIKSLAVSQWALISSAFRVLKQGGVMLYATCALSKYENDEIISRLCKKFTNANVRDSFEIDYDVLQKATGQSNIPDFEKTEFGFHVLPDLKDGAGPLYFSIIDKLD